MKFGLREGMNNMSRLLLFFFCVLALIIAGCATPAKPTAMIPGSYDIKNKHPYSVYVETAGGNETSPLWTSQLSDEDFSEALVTAITNSGLFSKVINGKDADYLLEVIILSLNQPGAGFDMTVSMVANWELTKIATNQQIWSDLIASKFTATGSDSFVGIERLRIATEGAAKENINKGINRLASIELE
jgi:hypothetical protein